MEAYSALTSGHVDRLFSMARLIVGNDDRAADAVQDALLNAWLDLRALRDPDRFDAWLPIASSFVSATRPAKRHRTRTYCGRDKAGHDRRAEHGRQPESDGNQRSAGSGVRTALRRSTGP